MSYIYSLLASIHQQRPDVLPDLGKHLNLALDSIPTVPPPNFFARITGRAGGGGGGGGKGGKGKEIRDINEKTQSNRHRKKIGK